MTINHALKTVLTLCLIITGQLEAVEYTPLKISMYQYSPSETPPIEHQKILGKTSPRNWLTLLSFSESPKEDEIIISLRRPLMNERKPTSKFKMTKKFKKGEGHFFVIDGNGYFPGEQVNCKIFSKESGEIYYEAFLTPQPIHITNPSGTFAIDATLNMLLPMTNYELRYTGMKKGERYSFKSISYGEILSHPLTSDHSVMSYSPDVIGRKGGLSTITLRVSNEDITFTLPWGTTLLDYLKGGLVYSPTGPQKCKIFNPNNN